MFSGTARVQALKLSHRALAHAGRSGTGISVAEFCGVENSAFSVFVFSVISEPAVNYSLRCVLPVTVLPEFSILSAKKRRLGR